MALTIPTTQESTDQNLAGLEGAINQTSPLNDVAFLRVLSVIEAMMATGLYKYGAERAKQNLALTATGEDLDRIGAGYKCYRKTAEYTKLTASVPSRDGVTVGIEATFTGDVNGVRYTMDAAALATGGAASLALTADEVGTVGNLQPGDTLTIVSQVAGVETTATVTAVTNTGTNDETDDEYRPRVLFAERVVRGGGNAADYKVWAEEVGGVLRAFPYAGRPVSAGDSYPGDRLVYVEAVTSIDPNGVPSAGLLDEVRAVLRIDPLTGKSRPGLGMVDSTLWVEPITRTAVAVTITGLTCPAGTDAAVRSSISSALTNALLKLAPWIEGVDLPQDKNDSTSTTALSAVVQSVLSATGSTAESVAFSVGGVTKTSYTLAAGELIKLGVIDYAV